MECRGRVRPSTLIGDLFDGVPGSARLGGESGPETVPGEPGDTSMETGTANDLPDGFTGEAAAQLVVSINAAQQGAD